MIGKKILVYPNGLEVKMLKLVEFIKNNPDWETRLQNKPYCISIKTLE